MSWANFAKAMPELASFGQQRLAAGPAYLATIRADGWPRVHPITPIIGGERLFVFMEPTSPKGHDLRRNGRYTLHCGVGDNNGGLGEFYVSGTAQLVTSQEERAIAEEAATYEPAARYILFELDVTRAFSTVYAGDQPIRQSWKAPQ
ncbi:MAG: pyridoxamine 5'-phosphate oxidase [Chloroflexi bacterium]|nr:pyridoxamine 5'-phosphate oxidase [Chloroflexota bacterium]